MSILCMENREAIFERDLIAFITTNDNTICVERIVNTINRGNCRIYLKIGSNKNVKVSRIQSCSQTTSIDRLIGHIGKFLKILIVDIDLKYLDYHHLNEIGVLGFSWLGYRFEFIASKNPPNGKSFFIMLENNNSFLSANNIRESIASFSILSNISKIGLRLSLLISNSYEGLKLNRNQIIFDIIDDATNANDNCFTNGSGFISSDLALQLPIYIRQGKIITKHMISNPNIHSNSMPACFQVRILCHLGIFKGTLVVHPYLKNTILIRNSMQKVLPANIRNKTNKINNHHHHHHDTNQYQEISTNRYLIENKENSSYHNIDRMNTPFSISTQSNLPNPNPNPIQLSNPVLNQINNEIMSNVTVDVVNTCTTSHTFISYLNRYLILLLVSRGVPEEIFIHMFR